MENNQHWAQKKERGSLLGIYFLIYIFKIFGAVVCKIIMTPVLIYFYIFNSTSRRNIKKYLVNISQDKDVYIAASQWNVFKVIMNFGFSIIDKLSAWTGKLTYKKLNIVKDLDFLNFQKENKGVILLVSHLGNFEISRAFSQHKSSAKFNIFMHTKNSEKISKALKSLNNEYDFSIIQGDELNLSTVMILKEKIESGEHIVIAGDRVPVNNNKGTLETVFLGNKARFPIGPFVLAKVLECPIITLYCLKNRKKYEVYFELLLEQVKFSRNNRNEVLQCAIEKYASNLEFYTKKAPLQWYNFHEFWKNKE